jgi:multidrug efflux system outer membrane protein
MNRSTRRWATAAAISGTILAAGCAVGPDYHRPQVPAPPNYPGLEGPAAAESLADAPWWKVFDDPVLQGLIRESVAKNYDLRVAVDQMVAAREQAGVAKSFLFPQVDLAAGYNAQQASVDSQPPLGQPGNKTYQNWNVGLTLAWQLDFFGQLRRQKESAFAQYLASEQGRRSVLITLVSDVASAYFQLRQLDLQLVIAKRTLGLNQETVKFYSDRLKGGVSNRLEVDQSVANEALTAATIPQVEQQIATTEHALCLLLGRVPGPIERGRPLDELQMPPSVPAGIPAALLERRPDVVQAEDLLVSANANVGAAKALFFPAINLTGLFGGVSHDLSNIVKANAGVWSLGAGLLQPVFNAGRIKHNYEATKAQSDAAVAQYQKAALNGYREVADSLVTIEKLAAVRAEQEKGVAALRDAGVLVRQRYDSGRSNYLEILIADQDLFQLELQLAQTEGSQLQALAQLYRALGGGWQPEAPTPVAGSSPPPAQ